MIMEASRKAFEALISPSAAITLALASLLASASAAMARCNCSGNLASFLKNENFIKKWEFALKPVTNSCSKCLYLSSKVALQFTTKTNKTLVRKMVQQHMTDR